MTQQGKAANPDNVYNYHWTLADMDKLAAMVQRRATAWEIANRFACDAAEVRAVCERNGLALWKSSERATK